MPTAGHQRRPGRYEGGRWWLAAPVYAAAIFAVGFALGAARMLWLAPLVGDVGAVAIELPLMLWVSWVCCGWCLRRFDVSAMRHRAPMGAMAFLVLMVMEATLALAGFGMTIADYAAGFLSTAGALGLLGQIAFGLLPLVHPGRDSRRTL